MRKTVKIFAALLIIVSLAVVLDIISGTNGGLFSVINVRAAQTAGGSTTVITGDINNDGSVDTRDLTRFMKYLSGQNVTVNKQALDTNNDGKVNSIDLVHLMKIISGEEDISGYMLDLAYYMLKIEYADGNISSCVTENITLPATVDVDEDGKADVTVTWKSSDGKTVSAAGKVTRPDKTSKTVTLTATLSYNGNTKQKSFDVTVIRKAEHKASDIPDHKTADQLAKYNNGTAPEIIYDSDDAAEIDYIDGTYTDIKIECPEDAVLSLNSVKSILGIKDPAAEFAPLTVNDSEYGDTYPLQQMYKGLTVHGRTLTVVTNPDNTADMIRTGFLPGISISTTPKITEEAAVKAVKSHYGSGTEHAEVVELSVYTINEYEDDPRLVYIVWAYGKYKSGEYFDDCVFVDANKGSVLCSDTNIITVLDRPGEGQGYPENSDDTISFPITPDKNNRSYLEDWSRGIHVYNGSSLVKYDGIFTDRTAVSAYTNMIDVYDWYYIESNLKQKSIDPDGKYKIKIYVHDKSDTDNAGFVPKLIDINIYDRSGKFIFSDNLSDNSLTMAACKDVVAHEYTHAVNNYKGNRFTYNNESGAINEAYSDIMAALYDNNWTLGETREVIRDSANPEKSHPKSPSIKGLDINGTWYAWQKSGDKDKANKNSSHHDSTIISHAAYLMYKNGIRGDKLIKLWYYSMDKGYSNDSSFIDVKHNIVATAKDLGFKSSEIQIIENAFDEVNVCSPKTTVSVKVIAKNDKKPIKNVSVSLAREDLTDLYMGKTDKKGFTPFLHSYIDNNCTDIYPLFKYSIVILHEGYKYYCEPVSIIKGENNQITVELEKKIYSNGDGTEENPYQVSTPEQLDAVRNDLSAHYVQVCDIDMADWGSWMPIGRNENSNTDSLYEEFTGSYDGKGYAIKNLKINYSYNSNLIKKFERKSDFWGLFACTVADYSNLHNINLTNIDYYIRNDTNETISVYVYVGGVTGGSEQGIYNCKVSGKITIIGGHDVDVGGITAAGDAWDCENYASIKVIADRLDDENRGGDVWCGGITGFGNAYCCSNRGNIKVTAGEFEYVGGISGYCNGDIENCVNYGNISANTTNTWGCANDTSLVGGIIGGHTANIYYSVNYGDISASSLVSSGYKGCANAGGIAGHNTRVPYSNTGYIINCINISKSVTAKTISEDDGMVEESSAGRIAGFYYESSGCYSLDETLVNGRVATVQHPEGTDIENGISCSRERLSSMEIYEGFDFEKIWIMKDGLPELRQFQ